MSDSNHRRPTTLEVLHTDQEQLSPFLTRLGILIQKSD